jgi:hypothetical protein
MVKTRLKLKTADFRPRTRSPRLSDPIQLAEILFRSITPWLAGETDGRSKRIEQAIDQIRNRLGEGTVRLDRDPR